MGLENLIADAEISLGIFSGSGLGAFLLTILGIIFVTTQHVFHHFLIDGWIAL